MKTTNNGFYKYSKVLTGEEMDEMAILADNMIDKACLDMKQRLSDRLNDGTLDLSLYDDNDNMILPKAILLALMEKEMSRYLGLTTDVTFKILTEKKQIIKVI